MKPEEGRALLEKHFCYSAPKEDFYYSCDDIFDPYCYLDNNSAFARGDKVKTDDIDFSFLFNWAPPEVKKYDIRVTICWKRDYDNQAEDFFPYRKPSCKCGILELCGNYNYYGDLASDDLHTHVQMVEKAREFFRKYKVMFAAAWNERYWLSMASSNLLDYFLMEYSEYTFYYFVAKLLFSSNTIIIRQWDPFYNFVEKLPFPKKRYGNLFRWYYIAGKRRLKLIISKGFARAHREGKYSHLPIEMQKLAIFEDIVRRHNLFDMHD